MSFFEQKVHKDARNLEAKKFKGQKFRTITEGFVVKRATNCATWPHKVMGWRRAIKRTQHSTGKTSFIRSSMSSAIVVGRSKSWSSNTLSVRDRINCFLPQQFLYLKIGLIFFALILHLDSFMWPRQIPLESRFCTRSVPDENIDKPHPLCQRSKINNLRNWRPSLSFSPGPIT